MKIHHILLLLGITTLLLGCPQSPPEHGILIFSKTEGFRHESIEPATAQLQYIGKRAHLFWTDHTEDATMFTSEILSKYKAVLFLSTTQDVLNESQQQAFKTYINNGGGFIGIHAATDTEYDWPWYNKLVGAYFESHPEGVQTANIRIKDSLHPSTASLPNPWTVTDELYNFKDISKDIHIIATIDESTYDGGNNGEFHPISWSQEYDGGRMFYTGLGHTTEMYSNDLFLAHLLGGISYVLNGDKN